MAVRFVVSKKRKLRKHMQQRGLDGPALVVCVGRDCCRREESRATLDAARTYAATLPTPIRVVATDCLHICKKGPIAATYPTMKFKKHVSPRRAGKMLDKLSKP